MTSDARAWRFAACLLVWAAGACAEPSSLVAWTPDTVKWVESGDAARGRAVAAGCASCHGETGVSTSPDYPSLAGQRAAYLYKQLADYKADKRSSPIMTPFAATLTERAMIDVAAYYATRRLPRVAGSEAARGPVRWWPAVDETRTGGQLVRLGAPQRRVTACAVCHGQTGEGARVGVPALQGQTRDYMVKTMREYRAGQRHNDVYGVMREIARNLTDSDIDALAAHYAPAAPRGGGVASQ